MVKPTIDDAVAAARRQGARLLDEPMLRVVLRNRVLLPYRRWRFHSFGDHSILDRPAWVYGAAHIAVGTGVVILRGAWLSAERRTWDQDAPALQIGNRVWVRPYCTISAAESVVIEDDVVIASHSTVIDSDHTYAADVPNVLFNPVAPAPVRIGQGTWIGERVAVLRGATIGRFCVIGSNSVVRGEIPDYSVAVGAPARVVGSTRADQGR
jgi:lipopolysaccharide O-acetyltransferase